MSDKVNEKISVKAPSVSSKAPLQVGKQPSVIGSQSGKQSSVIASKIDAVSSTKSTISKEPHAFKSKTFKGLKPITGVDVLEVDIDDVKFYMQHEDEYKVQKGERLIPYIVRMNERYKTKVESRIRNRKVKRGMTIFFALFGLILTIILIVYLLSRFKN
ncbi:hypothetical protein GVAV_002121 [Gurleya vavrai]